MTFEIQYWMVLPCLAVAGLALGYAGVRYSLRPNSEGLHGLAFCWITAGVCWVTCGILAVDVYRDAEAPRIVEEGRCDRRAGMQQDRNPYRYDWRREPWDRGWREQNRAGSNQRRGRVTKETQMIGSKWRDSLGVYTVVYAEGDEWVWKREGEVALCTGRAETIRRDTRLPAVGEVWTGKFSGRGNRVTAVGESVTATDLREPAVPLDRWLRGWLPPETAQPLTVGSHWGRSGTSQFAIVTEVKGGFVRYDYRKGENDVVPCPCDRDEKGFREMYSVPLPPRPAPGTCWAGRLSGHAVVTHTEGGTVHYWFGGIKMTASVPGFTDAYPTPAEPMSPQVGDRVACGSIDGVVTTIANGYLTHTGGHGPVGHYAVIARGPVVGSRWVSSTGETAEVTEVTGDTVRYTRQVTRDAFVSHYRPAEERCRG